ncbi:HdeD family acid-resistance protein [Streptomyces natalensis]|uniref:Membrane protein n=1 Tax=Streptomyces natalensis ATCC 27448 TaxID=1240678 RepID=A0A0D7CMW6_9ACTN|nr:HdeD family acid-resistance protein [Streptomyces natalensis]KIZ16757.1 membrane protein [Streptomyces natalensis ATCC 27448]
MASSSFDSSDAGPPRGTEPQDASGTESLGGLANMGWQALLTMGLAAIALGVVVLAWPQETLRVVGVLFGVYLLVIGVFQLAAAFGTHVPRHLRALHFLTGALSVLLGLICFRGTLESILLLALWIGFGWLVRGIMVTATAASAPREMPARGWMLFSGIIGLLAGTVLIVAPFTSIAALTLTVSIMAIVLGVVEVFHAIRMRADVGRLAPGTTAQRRPLFHSRPHPQH